MHVVKKEFMYVSKPFGGEEGGRVCDVHNTFFLKKNKGLSAHYVPTTCAHTMPAQWLYIVCTNVPYALHGVLLLGASKHG